MHESKYTGGQIMVENTAYRHVQIGWESLIFLCFLGYLTLDPGQSISLIGIAILVCIAMILGSLTIQVEDKQISWFFGPGLFKKQIALDQIESIEVSKKPLLSGYGSRCLSDGNLYTVSGRTVLKFKRISGKYFYLGTNDKDKLLQCLQSNGVALVQSTP